MKKINKINIHNCALFLAYFLVFCLVAWLCFVLVSSSISNSRYASADRVHTTTEYPTITATKNQHGVDQISTSSNTEPTTEKTKAPAITDDYKGDDFLYTIEENKVAIIGYEGNSKIVKVPSSINGKQVVKIKSLAFENNKNIEKVVVPSSVLEIKDEAFVLCTNLKKVELSEGLTTICNDAFSYCFSLETIVLPDSVTFLGVRAFEHCTSLKNITLSNNLASIGAGTFSNCKSLKSIVIPNSVTKIGYNAFFKCKNLKNVVIPETLTDIDQSSFAGCTSLENN